MKQNISLEKIEPVDKPGSVESNHLSGMFVAKHLKRPTQTQYGSYYRVLIWSCSKRGLPCRDCYQPRGALLPHLFTLTPSLKCWGGLFSVALSVGSHLPGVTWRFTLWSPDFPPCINTEQLLGWLRKDNSTVTGEGDSFLFSQGHIV